MFVFWLANPKFNKTDTIPDLEWPDQEIQYTDNFLMGHGSKTISTRDFTTDVGFQIFNVRIN